MPKSEKKTFSNEKRQEKSKRFHDSSSVHHLQSLWCRCSASPYLSRMWILQRKTGYWSGRCRSI